MRKLPVLLLSCLLSVTVLAEEGLIRLSPDQAVRSGVVSAALSDLKGGAGIRLPAQVVVPPAQIEVVAAPLPAMVGAVKVAYGETVRKGQPLARLQGAQILELQREFAQAQAQAGLAAENLRRDESLLADGIIPQGRLAATRAAERQAAMQLAEKRQALRMAGAAEPGTGAASMSGSAEIRAPFDGVVLEAAAQPGQRVDAATPLFKLGRLTPLWLEIQATPAQAAGLSVGDAVTVPGCTETGRVALIAPHMQAASQSLLIRAELSRPAGCVKPFQYIQAVLVPSRQPTDRNWRIPVGALARHQGQAWIFVETAGGYRPVAVKVMDEVPEGALVAVELDGSARLALKGVATLKAIWLGLGAGESK